MFFLKKENIQFLFSSNLYFQLKKNLGCSGPTLGRYREDNFPYPMLISALFEFLLEGHRESRNEIEFISSAECILGSDPEIFRFYHNASTH